MFNKKKRRGEVLSRSEVDDGINRQITDKLKTGTRESKKKEKKTKN